MGVGLSNIAEEGSHQANFLQIFEDSFSGDVRPPCSRNNGVNGKAVQRCS